MLNPVVPIHLILILCLLIQSLKDTTNVSKLSRIPVKQQKDVAAKEKAACKPVSVKEEIKEASTRGG